MPDILLHQYATSPFCEKLRLILGHKRLAWGSVEVPPIMPKPDAVALTGGYRRTPFLQIGADIYCDTALICDVLEHRQPEPTLYPQGLKGSARIIAQWADSTLFWAAMAYNFQPKGAAEALGTMRPEVAKSFGEDRARMSAGNMTRLRPADAAAAYKSYLRRIAKMLEDGPFLQGALPSLADFACYHPLWFTRVRTPGLAAILETAPGILEWMDRMAAIGHGNPASVSPADAIDIAAASTPAPVDDSTFQDEHGIPLGSRVVVHAETFGLEQTEGELLAATRMHYTLRRTDPRAGTVHVHFPRIGFALKKADPATPAP